MTTDPGVPAEKRLPVILPLVLILMFVAGLYASTIDNELTYWDDNRYVTDNPRVRDLSVDGIIKIFDPGDIVKRRISLDEYLPVTTLTHAIVFNINGLNPAGYHIANLLLYLIDIVLLYYLLNLIIGNTAVSLLSVLTFSVLTVHVESVTWVSGTKDMLSFLFMILSFIAYIRFVRKKEGGALLYYVLSLVLFTLGLLSKTLVVTLPALLMLFDLCVEKRGLKIVDKLPYLALGAFFAFVYMRVNRVMAESVYLSTSVGHYRIFLTDLIVLKDYIRMSFLPINLNAFYYYFPEDIPRTFFDWRVIFSFFVVAGSAAAGVVSYLKGKRLITFSIFWFFIAFTPILNIIPSTTLRADRYLFIPSVGFSLLVGWSVWKLTGLNAFSKKAVPVVFAAWIILLSILTFQRNGVWQNGITLWRDSIEKNPASQKAHSLLAAEYQGRGMFDEAIAQYEVAQKLLPGYVPVCNNLGVLYGIKGRYGLAERLLKECLVYNPDEIPLMLNLAKVYTILGKKELAREELAHVLRMDPENPAALSLMRRGM